MEAEPSTSMVLASAAATAKSPSLGHSSADAVTRFQPEPVPSSLFDAMPPSPCSPIGVMETSSMFAMNSLLDFNGFNADPSLQF